MRQRPLLSEAIPDGTFGGVRPRRGEQPRRVPDPDAARHWAELGAAVAEIDQARGYGVSRKYRQSTETAA